MWFVFGNYLKWLKFLNLFSVKVWGVFVRLRVSLGCLEFDICELSRNFRFVLSLTSTTPNHILLHFSFVWHFSHVRLDFFISFSEFLAILQNSVQIAIHQNLSFLSKKNRHKEWDFQNFFGGCEFGWNFGLKWLLIFFPQSESFMVKLFCKYREMADCFCTQRC